MNIHDRKTIGFDDLKVGMKLEAYIHKQTRKCLISSALIIHDIKDKTIEFYSSWGSLSRTLENADEYEFERKLTEEEYKEKYSTLESEILEALNNKLAQVDGYHEMWNGWLYAGSLTDIASELTDKKIHIIGYSPLMVPKTSFFGKILDIGVVAEYEDGERFWCHASDEYRRNLINGKYNC